MSANDSLLDIYLFETNQLLERLETIILASEKKKGFAKDQVDEIFRILHTIKGSSAMMGYEELAKLFHSMEDLMAYIREHRSEKVNHRKICDLAISSADFIRADLAGMQESGTPSGDPSALLAEIGAYYALLKNESGPAENKKPEAPKTPAEPVTAAPAAKAAPVKKSVRHYKAHVFFQKDCKMENVRAFGILKSLEGLCDIAATVPDDVLKENSEEEIVSNGFTVYMDTENDPEILKNKIGEAFFIQSLEFGEAEQTIAVSAAKEAGDTEEKQSLQQAAPEVMNLQKQNFMSVRIDKLDQLMNLVGEIVITEATVSKNPYVAALHIESFDKAARQLRKLTDELQDIVMSIRMIPVSATFHKMERIVRDMTKKTDKKAELTIIGDDTELDKNVIDNLSDPLMHIIRNCMDHGIETPNQRTELNKDPMGHIVLEARNSGGEVLIFITDDGQGLDKTRLIQKGIEKGLITKPASEITDKEAYALIFAAGFSTNDEVTEYSGRGVGMDVARRNIEKMGGAISVESQPGKGMSVQIRIPLTLAIIDSMQIGVGDGIYIIPLLSIKETFKPKAGEVFTDPEGNDMIMIRGNCHAVLRLNKVLGLKTAAENYEDGILMMVEDDTRTFCLFVDRLIGEQQTVIKPLPAYISRIQGWVHYVSGCTILGDGSVSLILDINRLLKSADPALA
jgi:two-component system chemotaxis sensor kinase CheA